MRQTAPPLLAASAALLLCALPIVAGHGHDEYMDNAKMDQSDASSYSAYHEHTGLIYAHVAFMIIGWIFVLPLAIILSVARSRFTLPVQFSFLILNGLGLLLGTIYNSKTPDLYENNAHHQMGWVATWVLGAQVVIGLVFVYSGRSTKDSGDADERAGFLPVTVESMAHHRQTHNMRPAHDYRWSGDSGQGTERNSASLHGDEESPCVEHEDAADFERLYKSERHHSDEQVVNHIARRLFRNTLIDRFMTRRIPGRLSKRLIKALEIGYEIVDRVMLPFGFVLVLSGLVTYSGIFRGDEIFNGMAHFVKGGIFFWYGLLTLGRWMGCFADFGWAWNAKPSRAIVGRARAAIPSAEFTESFVIFLYGSTNVFLEHLAAWGGEWTPQDFEHVAISILFFGGGLCGMLVESQKIRDLLNASLLVTPAGVRMRGQDSWESPKSYRVPLNPMPALIILLLGIMMGSHHQHSQLSTMIHKQWGTLFVGFSIARAFTYFLLYLSPPTSVLPTRPPTELISAFCLISGGIVFMASNRDTVTAMENYDLNAMFAFTVTMGFTAFLMAWEILVLSVKGWAVRKEAGTKRNTRF